METCERKDYPVLDAGGIPYIITQPLVQINNLSYTVPNNGHPKLLLRDIGTEAKPFLVNDVKRIDVENQGQIVAVLGRSGGGKSTLFKLLAGLNKPTTGEILIPNGSNMLTKVKEGSVGFVQQTYPLSRNQSVMSMLMEAASMGKVPRKERKDLVNQYLKDWGIFNQSSQSANQLSGGQRQRVAIIEQLLCSHHFIILDEPFSGLDVKNVEALQETFRKITTVDEINTIFFSTHVIQLAMELADQIFVIGYEYDDQGNQLEGGTIIAQYDLKSMGIAWRKYGDEHRKIKYEIEELIKSN
jgi:ABC-type multidrug transport system ATPase subunit